MPKTDTKDIMRRPNTPEIIRRLKEQAKSIHNFEIANNIPPGTIRNVTSQRSRNPGTSTLQLIADKLGCSIDDISHSEADGASLSPITRDTNALYSSEPFKPMIYVSASQLVADYLGQNNISVSVEEFQNLITEIYDYSLREYKGTVDKNFADWVLDKFKKSRGGF